MVCFSLPYRRTVGSAVCIGLFASWAGLIPLHGQNLDPAGGAKKKTERAKSVLVQVVPNLIRFDTKRFDVSAGAPVEVTLKNGCIVPHNIVFLGKDAESAVIAGVNAMGVEGMSRNYVPEVSGILAASKLLQPRGSETLKFTAPAEPGEYLFLCTFPGHWFTMRGVMRVRAAGESLAPAEREKIKDQSVPDALKDSGITHLPMGSWEKPLVLRSFLPDPGLGSEFFAHHGLGKQAVKYDPNTRLDMTAKEKHPVTGEVVEKPIKIPSLPGIAAPIAVSFGKDFSFAWDTTECRLLYAWRGGFLDMNPYWGKEPGGVRPKVYLPDLVGQLIYKASGVAPVRVSGNPAPVFEGYRMSASGPEFLYRLGERRVSEKIIPKKSGGFDWEIQADGPGVELWISESERVAFKEQKSGKNGWRVAVKDRPEPVKSASPVPTKPSAMQKSGQAAE